MVKEVSSFHENQPGVQALIEELYLSSTDLFNKYKKVRKFIIFKFLLSS